VASIRVPDYFNSGKGPQFMMNIHNVAFAPIVFKQIAIYLLIWRYTATKKNTVSGESHVHTLLTPSRPHFLENSSVNSIHHEYGYHLHIYIIPCNRYVYVEYKHYMNVFIRYITFNIHDVENAFGILGARRLNI
jgi:hypothetical protein